MIVTVTLNPCVDRTVRVEGFAPGRTNRVVDSRCDAGGKGVNVAVALRGLGEEACCLGFNFSEDGALLTETLERLGIESDFVPAEGRLRANVKIFDLKAREMTELNEAGSEVGPRALERLEETAERHLPKAELLVLSGSAPPGVPDGFYRRRAERAARHGVRTVIDARGPLLLEGLAARPYLIKPNRDELQETFGETVDSRADAVRVARRAVALGAGMVCVSLGKDGALLVTADAAYFSAGADIEVRGVQGAGDSLVAGVGYAAVRGMPLPELLRCGVAAAHASLLLEGTQMCTRAGFLEMLPRIDVEKLE